MLFALCRQGLTPSDIARRADHASERFRANCGVVHPPVPQYGRTQPAGTRAATNHRVSTAESKVRKKIDTTPADQCPGRCRPLQPRQRKAARTTQDQGRAGIGAHGPVHGQPLGRPLQPAAANLLSAPAGAGQTQESRADCLHAQADRHAQRHAPRQSRVALSGDVKC